MLTTDKQTGIRLTLFDDMSQCTDAEVERLLPLVSAQRREVALRFKFTFGRFTCLKSYVMLQQLVVHLRTVHLFEILRDAAAACARGACRN